MTVATLHGSALSFPVRPDERGTLATVGERLAVVEESILSILETRQGERPMMPDYGIPDFVFSVRDSGFTARVGFFLSQQLRRYEPLIESVAVKLGSLQPETGGFFPGFSADESVAAINLQYTVRGSNVPQNLVFPTRVLRELTGA